VATVLFIHGIRNDDPAQEWAVALNRALGRQGLGFMADSDLRHLGPSWLRLLRGPEPAEDPGAPPLTYVRGTDEEHQRAIGLYYRRQAALERRVRHMASRSLVSTSWLRAKGLDQAAGGVTAHLLVEVEAYGKSAARRNACLRALLSEVPAEGELVIIGHSLGSVLAADLLYHLPPAVDVGLLVTIGSPLARKPVREHLRRIRSQFPFERVGPWLNVVGVLDPVAVGAGITEQFPEALEVFVDTGKPSLTAHAATTYLDQDVVAQAFAWLLDERDTQPPNSSLPEVRAPDWVVRAAAEAQYALRLEQRMDPGSARIRFGQARAALAAEAAQRARETGDSHPLLERLDRDNGEWLRGRFSPSEATAFLLGACMGNPVAPYEIRFDDKHEQRALEDLAQDLGFPAARAQAVLAAEQAARKVHGSTRSWHKTAMLAAGAAALLATPWMVVAAAPGGRAGGAGIVAGLAALGPGGMVGGLGIVGLVSGAGGAAIASSLTSGSVEAVEETVISLHAHALAEQRLHETELRSHVWVTLIEMRSSLAAEKARLESLSDARARIVKELERKLRSVQRALDALDDAGLGAKTLTEGPS
jgi:hypothetical protein